MYVVFTCLDLPEGPQYFEKACVPLHSAGTWGQGEELPPKIAGRPANMQTGTLSHPCNCRLIQLVFVRFLQILCPTCVQSVHLG